MPTLNWRSKSGDRSVYSITKSIITIGADHGNDVVLLRLGLNPHHARIIFDGRDFSIAEGEGSSLIQINGKRRRKARLTHEDRITMANAELIFNMLDLPQTTKDTDISNKSEIEGLRRLQRFSSNLMQKESPDALIEELMDAVVDLTGASKGFLVLFEDDKPTIRVARNIHRENMDATVSELSDSIMARIVETKKAIIVSDAQSDEIFSTAESVISLRLSSVMCVPLMERGRLFGLIYLGNDSVTGLFEASTLETLKVFAAQASMLVQNSLLLSDLRLRNLNLSKELEQQRFGDIVGSSFAMKEVFKNVAKVAGAEVSVLIGGETGTGKELIAHEMHRRSPRVDGPFITVNCGAIPENLMESEFFGYVKGAFTGAHATRIGKFQAADKGTIFLDEIGEMPLSLQVKILRVLQERQVVKVGSTKSEIIDIRVLAATNRNLEEEIKAGRFREDLFYRINVVHIDLPPLRDRADDVVLLAKYLIRKYVNEFNTKVKGFTPNAIIAMKKHNWPGNVRELENRLKKAVILCEGSMIGPKDIDLDEDALPRYLPLMDAKEQFQKKYILEALDRNNGNRTKTANDLDVDPRTIFRYLEKV